MYIDLYYTVLEKLNELAESEDVQEHAVAGMALPFNREQKKTKKKKNSKKRTKSPSDYL
jgi:hypothetical protein